MVLTRSQAKALLVDSAAPAVSGLADLDDSSSSSSFVAPVPTFEQNRRAHERLEVAILQEVSRPRRRRWPSQYLQVPEEPPLGYFIRRFLLENPRPAKAQRQ